VAPLQRVGAFLSPALRRWIAAAKREETRARRITEAIGLLAAGKKLGLK
jgi:uncharacterized protein YdeI (YjbR/CyaY-like superfamily)